VTTRRLLATALAALTVLCAVPLRAQAPAPRPRLAVLPLAGNNVAAHVPLALDDVIAIEISRSQRFEVIASGEIRSMLGLEEMKQAVGCDDASCIAEIGGALDVTYVVSGKVSRLGEQFHVSLTMSDVKAARVEARALETAAADEGLLPDAARRAVASLLREQLAPPPVALGPVAARASDDVKLRVDAKAEASPWPTALLGGGLVAGAGCVGSSLGMLLSLGIPYWNDSRPSNGAWQLMSPCMVLCGTGAGVAAAAGPALFSGELFSTWQKVGLLLLPAAVGSLLGGGFGLLWMAAVVPSPANQQALGATQDEAIGLYVVFGLPLVAISSLLGGATFSALALFWGDGSEAAEPAIEVTTAPAAGPVAR
jgi:TolB-like protein